jgi:hypothetical protein
VGRVIKWRYGLKHIKVKIMMMYTISKDKSGVWYCHKKGYDYIPVFGSIGDKKKAQSVCKMMNRSIGK